MTIKELEDNLRGEIKSLDEKINAIKVAKYQKVIDGQKEIKRQWDINNDIKNGARVVIGPKMYQLCLRFGKYRLCELSCLVIELSASKAPKEGSRSNTTLQSFLGKYRGIEFVNPNDPRYNDLHPLDVSKLSSWQGFKVGQNVTWRAFSSWRSTHYEGKILKFTRTGKASIAHKKGGTKEAIDISKLSPLENE